MKWIGQHIYDLVARFRNDVFINNSDLYVYHPSSEGNPTISLGSSDTERLEIKAEYESSAQGLDVVKFITHTAGTSANDARFAFQVDETSIMQIKDAGLNLDASMNLSIGGTDILADSSGTTTLSNIDDLDATTIATFNAHLTAGDITGVVLTADDSNTVSDTGGSADFTIAGNNGISTAIDTNFTISGVNASTSAKGVVELATTAETTTGTDTGRAVTPDGLKDGYQGSTNVTTLGTISTGVWQGDAIASAYLDSDTAHLTTNQTFSGVKTFSAQAIFDGNQTLTPGDGAVIHQDSSIITDGNTSASGTAALATIVNIEGARLDATNSSVTTTSAASLYIKAAPSAGTNQTITNAYALYVDDGLVKFDGALTVGGTITGDVTGDLTGQADTVATIAGLAPNTATTQATQAAITTCANLATVGTITIGVWNGTAIAHAYIGADAIEGDNLADNAVNSEHYTDGSIDTVHIGDDQVTFAKAIGVSPKVYGSKIKLLPTDFEANEDGGATKSMQFDDTAPTGIKPGSAATELLAFASIPEGMKATHVDIYAGQNLTMECFELNVNASGLTSKGSGTTNTTLDITDVNATATNYIMIIVTTTATSDRVWGGEITIAAQ